MIICVFVVFLSLFIVDELFLGLDLLVILDLINFLVEEKVKGKFILMLIYVLDFVEKMCDCFVILYKGEIWVVGILEELWVIFGDSNVNLNDIYIVLIKEV